MILSRRILNNLSFVFFAAVSIVTTSSDSQAATVEKTYGIHSDPTFFEKKSNLKSSPKKSNLKSNSKKLDSSTTTQLVDSSTSTQLVDSSTTTQLVDSSTTTQPVDSSTSTQLVDSSTSTQLVDSSTSTQPVDSSTSTQPVDSSTVEATISATPTSGAASLTVNLNAAGNASHTYQWDFGDNSIDTGQSVSHIYNTPGTYTVILTVNTSDGGSATSTRNIYVFGSSVDNTQAIVPEGVYFFDDFDYAVSRDGDSATSFTSQGWSGAKADNISGSGKGYLYTTTSIPGYSGPLPGRNSGRVLALEGRPSTNNFQTDFYLQYGSHYANEIPGDVWFQFWMYINHYDDPTNQNDQMSRFGRNGKLIYPTKDAYPTHSSLWIMGNSMNSKEPLNHDLGDDSMDFFINAADIENISYTRPDNSTNWKIGQTNLNDRPLANRWVLVKLHMDTSTTSGKFEQWLKPMGGQWTKVTEWIDGVTPNFSWQIPAGDVGGHRTLRMPTTLNPCVDPNLSCDFWMYMDDFAIATSEDTLPVYPY